MFTFLERPAQWLRRRPDPGADTRTGTASPLLPQPQPPVATSEPRTEGPALDLTFELVHGPEHATFRELCRFLCRDPVYWRQTRRTRMTEARAADLLGALPSGAKVEHRSLWALRRDGRLVGCLEVVRHWPAHHTATIAWLVVDLRERRHGIGRAAVQHVLSRCRAWPGVMRVRMSVVESQPDALAFCHATGFRETGQRVWQPDQLAPDRVFERPLPP